ncbi:MAG: hypothetical protein O3C60_08545 [Planctomycetota bacterium]|nr:hypothetical protein [Planctomycetota bacterium]
MHGADYSKWFHAAIVSSVVAVSTFLLIPNHADPDLWGHVQFGRDLLEYGLPTTATYTYTAEGYPWINHENLSELAFACVVSTWGIGRLVMLGTLLGLVIVSVITFRAWRQSGDPFAASLLGLLVALNLVFHWSLRPQLLSFLFFCGVLLLLEYTLPHRKKQASSRPGSPSRRTHWLWGLVAIMWLWTNSHGGFAAGLAIVLVYLLGRVVEDRFCNDRFSRAELLRIALVTCAILGSTLINPYGFGLHKFMLSALAVPRPEITEWHGLQFGHPQTWLFLLMVVAWLAVIVHERRKIDPTAATIMALVLWQACLHHRHIAFFATLFGWWYGRGLASLVRSLRGSAANEPFGADLSATARKACIVGLYGVTLIVAGTTLFKAQQVEILRDEYPVSALEFMTRHQMRGNAIVTFNWSQYVLAACGARLPDDDGIRLACDGRFETCYPHEIRDLHFDLILGDVPGKRNRSVASAPFDASRTLRIADPHLALLDRRQPHSLHTMKQAMPPWIRLYQDSTAELWGLASRYDDPTSPHYIPVELRETHRSPQTGSVAWPAIPGRDDATRPVSQRTPITSP